MTIRLALDLPERAAIVFSAMAVPAITAAIEAKNPRLESVVIPASSSFAFLMLSSSRIQS